MRTGQPIIGRPAWYDRNSVPRQDYYEGIDVAPHSATTRLSYTVPAGKKAVVELLQARVYRSSTATASSLTRAWFTLIPSGGTPKIILMATIRSNNVGDKEVAQIGTTLTLFPGDKLEGGTGDLSTGGTCDYFLAYKLTEFDA